MKYFFECEVCHKAYCLTKTDEMFVYETNHPYCKELALKRYKLINELANVRKEILRLRNIPRISSYNLKEDDSGGTKK